MYGVSVCGDPQGSIIGISSNNPEYGYVRVECAAREIREGGWLKYVKRSALIKGLVTDLKQANFKLGEEIPGKIIVKESLEPFNPENPEKHLKRAGAEGVVLTVEGKPIYRESFYTIDPYKEDELISHDNTEEVKAQSEMRRVKTEMDGSRLSEMFRSKIPEKVN